MMRFTPVRMFVVLAVLLTPAAAFAQVAIAGTVKDSTGAVMPGVTVEAASPALIERSRSVVTDGAGQYKIQDLSPGMYDVTFTLSGFKTVKRTGIRLEGTFTAQVNADLEVGLVEESVTVTSEAPAVDVINNAASFVANRDVLDAIPTAVRNTPSRALLIPGTTVTPFVLGQYTLTAHGSASSDFTMAIDGLRVNNLCGSGQYSGFYMNDAAIQELTYITGAESAEIQSSGLRVNSVPRDGGNTFSGTFFSYGQGSGLQSDNRSDAVQKAGVKIAGTAYDWQVNPSFGGPLKKDKLWFYFTYKYEDHKVYVPSSTFADGSQAYRNSMGNYSGAGRITWAASDKDKIRVYIEKQFNGEFYNGFNTLPTTSPEASTDAWGRGWIPQVKWTRTHSNRLLFEAGIAYYDQPYEQNYTSSVGPLDLAHLEQTTGRLTVAAGNTIPPYTSWTKDYNIAASASYVTGTHAMKFGMTDLWGTNSRSFTAHGDINTLVFNAGLLGLPAGPTNPIACTSLPCPLAIAVANVPTTAEQKVNSDLGLFAQDTWTQSRLTLNYGARFDHFNASVPAESAPATTWVAARSFPEITNVPNWNDWAVRFAASYDLFGNGKTALKGAVGKYVAAQAAGYAANFNGMTYSTQTRLWLDFDRNGTIFDSNGNIEKNEVLGGTSNFGGLTVRPDPNLARGYNWEYNVMLQHELAPRLSVSAAYYRRQFYNLQVTDNQNLTLDDWNSFTIATPADSRLPLSGQTFTMYSLNQNKVGIATDNLLTYSTLNRSTYDGVEFTGNLRREKLLLFGGVTTDRLVNSSCDGSDTTSGSTARDNPNSLRFCDATLATGGRPAGVFRTTVKASAAYSLPYDVQVSGTFAAIPGPAVAANYTVTSALAGRSIIGSTAGATTIAVNLVQPNTVFLDYQNRLDMRVGKTFRFNARRAQVFVDVFNVTNAGTVTRVNETFSANPATNPWLTPLAIVDGRYARFGLQMSF